MAGSIYPKETDTQQDSTSLQTLMKDIETYIAQLAETIEPNRARSRYKFASV